jgi:hypothetical protein
MLANTKPLPLLAHSESKALGEKHSTAARSARAAGACWQCCAEMGCRATDRPGNEQDEARTPFKMHLGCMERIATAVAVAQ